MALTALGLALIGYIGSEAWTCGRNLNGWDWMLITGGATFLITIVVSLQAEKRLTRCLERLASRGVLRGGHSAVVESRAALRVLAEGAARSWARGILIAELGAMLIAQIIYPALVYDQISIFADGDLVSFRNRDGEYYIGVGLAQVVLLAVGGLCGYLTGLRFGTFITYGRLASILDQTAENWTLRPGHPDGASGLKPIGEFFQFQAQILVAPLLWLATWWVLAGVWPGSALAPEEGCLNRIDYRDWSLALLGLWIIVAVVMVTAFVVPVRQFHVRMADRKKRLLATEGPALRALITKGSSVADTAPTDPDYITTLHVTSIAEERLTKLENAPVWPTSVGLTAKVVVRYVLLAGGPVAVDTFVAAWIKDQASLSVIFRLVKKLVE